MSVNFFRITTPSSHRLRMGLIGLGYWGPNILRNLMMMPGVDLRMACDLSALRLKQISTEYPGVKRTRRAEDVFKATDIDAVAIATPVSTHYPLARAALAAKKHVFIEKPLSASTREAQALIHLAALQKRVLMVDHIFVYSSPVQKIKQLIHSKQIGTIYYVDAVRVNLGAFQRDVNVIWDLAPHDLSILDFLLSDQPQGISAVTGRHIHNQYDMAYLTIRYPGQLLAHVHVNWLAPAKIRQIIVGGSKRMVVYDDTAPAEQVKVYNKGVQGITGNQGQIQYRLGDMWAPHIEIREALRTALEHFVHCIHHRLAPLTDGHAGLRVVRMLEAACKSAASGGREIRL